MIEIPFFLPARLGDVSAIVTCPEGQMRGPGVVLLPGGRAGAGVLPLFQDLARSLAAGGQPVLRFDYPGSGLSSGSAPDPTGAHPDLVREICDWFMTASEIDEIALCGRCAGGRIAIAVAAEEQRVVRVLALVPHMELGARSLRSTLARLDAKGPRLAQKLIRRPRVHRPAGERVGTKEVHRDLGSDLTAAVDRAAVTLVFGEHDGSLKTFRSFVEEGEIGPETSEKVEIVSLAGAHLHGLPNVTHERRLGALLMERLAEPLPA